MACAKPDIPEYLHRNDKETLQDGAFSDEHYLYRFGNPIELPEGTITSISCSWSFLINLDNLQSVNFTGKNFDSYTSAIVADLRQYVYKKQKLDQGHTGWHKLTCVLHHTPDECNYSHSEINIRHQVFTDEDENEMIYDLEYTYDLWQKKKALLQNKPDFYKILKKNYRRDMIALFCN